jgi:hypothetical protein
MTAKPGKAVRVRANKTGRSMRDIEVLLKNFERMRLRSIYKNYAMEITKTAWTESCISHTFDPAQLSIILNIRRRVWLFGDRQKKMRKTD